MARKSKSSGRWMAEHQRDEFVRRAAAEGWRSRAVFKLEEIDAKDRLIKPGMTVVDLGAAPGGWSQYAVGKVGGRGHVIAMDLLEMAALDGVTFVQGDFTESSVLEALNEVLGGRPVDLVISDMAPNISGIKAVDQPRAIYLAELALDFASQVLTEDGSLLVKMFQGAGSDEFLSRMRTVFSRVKTRKPRASRPRSREVYVLGSKRRML